MGRWGSRSGGGGGERQGRREEPDICTKFEVAVECVGGGCGAL